jgi:uncharacterized protein (TIGR00725 family)
MDIVQRPRIGLIGGSRAGKKYLGMAEEVGRLVAQRDGILVCGGRAGVMEAACRGAKSAGGLTVGIIPGSHKSEANAYVDIAIATGMGYTRNSLVVMNSDVVIAVDGEYGTLSEIAYAFVYDKEVIGLGTWDIVGVVPAKDAAEAVERAFARLGMRVN